MTELNFDDVAWKDRSTLCAIAGALICLLGLSCLLFAPLLMFSAFLPHAAPVGTGTTETANPFGSQGMQILYYGMISICASIIPGVFWLWCGIGAIKRRKYARKLLAATTLAWAVLGGLYMIAVMVMFGFMFNMFAAMQGGAGGSFFVVFMVMYGVILLFFLVVIPSLLAYLFTRTSVIYTFAFYDQEPSWTDKLPVKLLAFTIPCIWLALCSMPYTLLLMSPEASFLTNNHVIQGIIWLLGSLAFIGLALYMHSLKPRAWRLMVICSLGACVYSVFAGLGIGAEMVSNLQEQDPKAAEFLGKTMSPAVMVSSALVFWGLLMAYLAYLKPSFRPASETAPEQAPAGA